MVGEMSNHYAMCKYDDATGSYIPLEVRPITDTLKNDDPLYKQGATSMDAEIVKLTVERDQLQAEVVSLKESLRLACEIREGTSMGEQRPLYWEQLQSKLAATETELAAEQAKNAELLSIVWEANKYLDQTYADLIGNIGSEWLISRIVDHLSPSLSKALSQPSDTHALEAIVNQAGEVMRLEAREMILRELFHSTLRINLIDKVCAIPAVTLEDLK